MSDIEGPDSHDDQEDRDALAAEFVLGTLDADERARAQTLIAVDEEFADAVRHWERRLGELHIMVEPVEPPAELWSRVRGAILPDDAVPAAPGVAPAADAPRSAEIVGLAERYRRWRRFGIAASLVAASLAAVVVVRLDPPKPPAPPPAPVVIAPAPRYVAALQRDADAPAFLLSVNIDTRTMTVRRVAAERQPGKSYELWLVSSRLSAPRSLGLVGAEEFTVRRALDPYDADTVRDATYAISIEPEGGSSTGFATGPVLYSGKLVEASPRPGA